VAEHWCWWPQEFCSAEFSSCATVGGFRARGGIGLAIALSGVSLSYFTNYWFPWLVIAGGQVPCALAWALVARNSRTTEKHLTQPVRPCQVVPPPLISETAREKGGKLRIEKRCFPA